MKGRIFRPGESGDYKDRLKQAEELAGVSQEEEDDTEAGTERELEKIHDTIVTLENSGLTEDERDEAMDRLINEVDLFRELYPDKPLPDEVNKYLPDDDN